jgi:hypothetical protein
MSGEKPSSQGFQASSEQEGIFSLSVPWDARLRAALAVGADPPAQVCMRQTCQIVR